MEDLRPSDPRNIGPYRLAARIGAGGMGVVYLARDESGTLVAVKLIRHELAEDPSFRARFAREVRAGQRVGGMCTARYLAADLGSNHPYLVTEYVPGGNLLDFVNANGPLEGERLVGLAVGLAEGLVAMGAAGVIHRDLKPSNVLMSTFALSRSPTFKLSTTGPRPFFLLHRTSLRPLTPADELGDLTGQMVG